MRDFNFATKRKTWKVTLPTEDLITVHIKSASKELMQNAIEVTERLEKHGNVVNAELLGDMWEIAALALSNNTENIVFDADSLVEILDIADLIAFIPAYVEFLNEITSSKN